MACKSEVDAVRDHYDRISVFYRALWGDHIHHGYWENSESPKVAQVKLVERLAKRAGIVRGSRVLDVGCGVGGSSLWLARNLDCEVVGVTISPVQAEMATEKARKEGLDERARFEVLDANHLDVEPESFDAVWVIECSEHLMDKARFIESCARALKPEGTLALCAWLAGEQAKATTEGAHLIEVVCDGMLCPSLASLQDYVEWMRDSGFDEIEAEDITGNVEETWRRCAALARRPEIKALLMVSDARTRRFVQSFDAIQQAYKRGAMAYGMFTAKKR
jgi:tocopherol O-methyltransferase